MSSSPFDCCPREFAHLSHFVPTPPTVLQPRQPLHSYRTTSTTTFTTTSLLSAIMTRFTAGFALTAAAVLGLANSAEYKTYKVK